MIKLSHNHQKKNEFLVINRLLIFFFLVTTLGNIFCCRKIERKSVLISADVNRDGLVDFDSDLAGKSLWTFERGALFLNNNDSDTNSGYPDYADSVVNGSEDLKDLAILRVRRNKKLPRGTAVHLSVDESSFSRVCIFLKGDNKDYSALDLRKGVNLVPFLEKHPELELRIEANSYPDSMWNGLTEVKISVEFSGKSIETDTVKLKVAPFILLSNLNKGKVLYIREFPGRNEAFIQSLKTIVPALGADLFIIPGGEPYPPHQIWLQDTMEIGYSEIPGQRMNVVLRANRGKALDDFAKNELLGPDFGWLEIGSLREKYGTGGGGNGWLDWYGNLEVTPPFPGHPLGRIYYGYNPDGPNEASLNPEIVAALEAQLVQSPAIRLDTGWLLIKHVDEVISFVPNGKNKNTYKIMVVDTPSLISLLENWVKQGYGNTSLLDIHHKGMTVKNLLENKELITNNRILQKERIEPNIDLLKKELRLSEEDFIRIPSLFTPKGLALIPNMVNSTVLNGHLLIIDPNGPKINGQDLLKEEIKALLSGLPLELHFVDARQYHQWSGEVHCGTNVRREGFNRPWWEMKYGQNHKSK